MVDAAGTASINWDSMFEDESRLGEHPVEMRR
jgi:hypothetical protein